MDGHVHITNRVYWEGIDPWKPQAAGLFDYARARQGGANVVIENIAPYGYENYNTTVKQVARLIETFYRVLEANPEKMELALTAAQVRRIAASGKMAVILGIESGVRSRGRCRYSSSMVPTRCSIDSIHWPGDRGLRRFGARRRAQVGR